MTGDVQLIGLDWGTSNLRAYLYDTQGRIVDTRHQQWGVRQLPDGGFPAAMRAITSGWPPCVTIAAGMVGSRQGWVEVPYVDVPVEITTIAQGLHRVDTHTRQAIWIVPGLRQREPANVMRGEETQIIGVLALQTTRGSHAHLVLPGTHSKWVTTENHRVTAFQTFMTGEMYSLMLKHSILGAGIPEEQDQPFPNTVFMRGVQRAKESDSKGAWSQLFSTRAMMLNGELASDDVAEFLSGLLIGEEFRVARSSGVYDTNVQLCIIGDASLCHRYATAAEHFGYASPSIVSDATSYGLWELARQSGLLAQASVHPFSGVKA
jgi:2-dehydro-3-deoxygalactonokinase